MGMKRELRNLLTATTALFAIGAFPQVAMAQQAADTDGDDDTSNFNVIIVTSKGTAQDVYEAPVAVTVFSPEALDSRNADSIVDIGKYVPNLTVTNFGAGNPSSQFPSIRGIGFQDHLIVIDPTVGVYVDGVYLGRQIGQNLNLDNIERLEVLRGPQGTLFGRNSVGGAVNIVTRQPGDEETASVKLQAGTRGRLAADFYGNTRLSDTLAASISFGIDRRNGLGDFLNIPNPEARVGELEDIHGRIALKWTPSDRLSIQLTADGNEGTNGQNPFTTTIKVPPGGCTAADIADLFGPYAVACAGGLDPVTSQSENPFDTNSGQADLARTSNSAYGFSGIIDYALSDALNLKFIGSYRFSDYEGGLDDDGAELDFLSFPEVGEAEQYSFELQLGGQSGIFDYVGGLYYFNEDGFNFQQPTTFNGFGDGLFEQTQQTESYAAYANLGVRVTEALRISGGLRFTHDSKDATADLGFAPEFGGSASFSEVTWEASATYALADRLDIYGTVARGYQSGQFPARPFGGADTFFATDPVTAINYEAGIKGEPTDWLQMALSVFHTTYNSFPAQVSTIGPNGFITVTDDAGDLRSIGVEWEGNVRLGAFSLNTAVGYIDSTFRNVEPGSSLADGNRAALTPRWTVAVGPQVEFDVGGGRITARADYSYRGSLEGQPNNSPTAFIDSRELLGFNVTYEPDGANWSITAYGKNITDERYTQGALDVGPYVLNILANDASEFGLKFGWSLGGN
ncbi:TonB-dependent receptor [Erythrobacter mangrovi]|uniref:TonB-dependent receptor n=1 Tax=Erythrobacter mangrovi TaxID=2739433 RepID=A0A7D4AV28_9SPHN|nr:TonB-dependent receptor [Erythrobacter mangrovi]QKG72397.1 TonB-dependent receptor [Erythrobacter mangrovi]